MYRVKELNVVRKKGKPGTVKIALAYPSIYEVAISSLAYQMIYFYVNSLEEFVAERFNLVTLSGEEPEPYSLETRTSLRKFEMIIFPVHYEPDYVNIARLLLAAGIDPRRETRKSPIVIVGGLPLMGNPEPLTGIADVIILGELEPTLPKLLNLYLENKERIGSFFDSLRPEEGFYVTHNLPEDVTVVHAADLKLEFHPIAQLQSLNKYSVWERATMIEVSRGCPYRCTFCLEGSVMGPKRDRPLSQVVKIALDGTKLNMSRKVILYSLSFFDHTNSDRILTRFINEELEFSVPSIRLETLNEERLELISMGGQKTLTVAPETASSELSFKLGKPLLREKLVEVAECAKKLGIKSLKLYFMVGLPWEKESDLRTIPKLVKEISNISGFKGERELKVNLTPFIPKPQTPLERVSMESVTSLRKKIKYIKSVLGGLADVKYYDPRWAYIQAFLSRGDSTLSNFIIKWAMYGGGLGGFRKTIKEEKPQKDFAKSLNGELPWDKVRRHVVV